MKWLLLLFITFLCAGVAGAQTAPTSQFQLDGTAVKNLSYPGCTYGSPCDYWDLINGSGTPGTSFGTGHSIVNTFVNGESSTEAFIGGGSKDPNLISSWACTSKTSPNKDTLTNGYAAAYSASGDLVEVFGADRLSTSGDANIGVWLFKEDVECNPVTGTFSGAHENGDVFLVSAFVTGGSVPLVSVYSWDNTCLAGVKNPAPGECADTNLRLKFSANALCDNMGTLSGEVACSITNAVDIPVTWPYPTATSTAPSTIPAQAFFTGGVDITSLTGSSGCFSSFLEETRSSQTTSAVLKDFIGGKLPVCSMSAKKACTGSSIDSGGTSVTYNFAGSFKNTGAATLSGLSISDVANDGMAGCSAPVLHGPFTTALGTTPCTSLAGGATCYYNGSVDCTFSSTTFDNVFTASASPGGGGPPITASASWLTGGPPATNGCAPTPTGTLSLAKSCSTLIASGSPLSIEVDLSGSITNNANVQVSNITITDAPSTTISITCGSGCTGTSNGSFTLAPSGTATYTGSYDTSNCTVLGTKGSGAGRCAFEDTVTASGTGALGAGTVTAGIGTTATCHLCPLNDCSAGN